MSPSSIEWTDETWNPTVGCSRVSPGCDSCYAIGVAHRAMQPAHAGLTVVTERGPDWTGEVRCLPDRLDTPLRWRRPRRVFVDSMSDLFHPDVPDDFIDQVFAVMALAERHTFQVLTKRPQRMAKLLADPIFRAIVEGGVQRRVAEREGIEGPSWVDDLFVRLPLPNVWLGTSVENQRYADLRIPHLLATPAAVRFLSCEPLLGPIDLDHYLTNRADSASSVKSLSDSSNGIDWVIAGGESGPHARPMHPAWARQLRDQCVAAGVPFHFKQWGAWGPAGRWRGPDHHVTIDGRLFEPGKRLGPDHMMQPAAMHRWGKKAAGRELDGRTWDEMPEPAA